MVTYGQGRFGGGGVFLLTHSKYKETQWGFSTTKILLYSNHINLEFLCLNVNLQYSFLFFFFIYNETFQLNAVKICSLHVKSKFKILYKSTSLISSRPPQGSQSYSVYTNLVFFLHLTTPLPPGIPQLFNVYKSYLLLMKDLLFSLNILE